MQIPNSDLFQLSKIHMIIGFKYIIKSSRKKNENILKEDMWLCFDYGPAKCLKLSYILAIMRCCCIKDGKDKQFKSKVDR